MSDDYEPPLEDLLDGLNLPDGRAAVDDEVLPSITINWRELLSSEAPDAWNNLRNWVEWLIQRYEVSENIVPDCWWKHGAITEELAALYTAWVASYDSTDSGYGPVGWHERWTAAKDRLRKQYSGQCQQGHQIAPSRTMPADTAAWAEWIKSSHATGD